MDVALAAASLAAASLLPSPFHDAGNDGSASAAIKPSRAALDVVDGSCPASVGEDVEKDCRVLGLRRRRARLTVRISLLLSLLLLSLGVLEAAPSTWLILLNNDSGLGAPYSPSGWFSSIVSGDGRIKLTGAYRVLLWADCVLVAVVAPAAVGGIVVTWLFPPRPRSSQPSSAAVVVAQSVVAGPRSRMGTVVSLVGSVSRKILLSVQFLFRLSVAAAGFVITRIIGSRNRRATPGLPHSLSNVSSSDLERNVQTTASPQIRSKRAASVPFWRNCTIDGGGPATRARELRLSLVPSRSFLAGAILGATVSFLLLRAIGSFVASGTGAAAAVFLANGRISHRAHRHHLLRDLVSRICALGVFLSQLLNGFGCVSLPYSCLSGLYLEPIDARTLADATESYKFLRKDLEDKRRVLADLRVQRTNDLPAVVSSPSLPFDIRRRCLSSSDRHPPVDAAESLRREIEFMETLSEELADDIDNMKDLRRAAVAARTPLGRVRGSIGVIFSVVLLVRVALAALSLARATSAAGGDGSSPASMAVAPDVSPRRKDPITMALLWLVGRDLLSQGEDFDAAAQSGSLVLTAFLSATQVRTFLRAAGALSRRLRGWFFCGGRRDNDADATAAALSLWSGPAKDAGTYLAASVLGCYFLACVVLVKRNLPVEHRSAFSSALGGDRSDLLAFDIRVTNGVFAASALASAFVLGSLFGIRRRNSVAHGIHGYSGPEGMKADV